MLGKWPITHPLGAAAYDVGEFGDDQVHTLKGRRLETRDLGLDNLLERSVGCKQTSSKTAAMRQQIASTMQGSTTLFGQQYNRYELIS